MEVRQDANVETSSEAKEMPADASAPSSESRESAGANNAASADENSLRTIALVIYGCMALGIFTRGLTSIVAVILASARKSTRLNSSHYCAPIMPPFALKQDT